jgi:hypothetical protein
MESWVVDVENYINVLYPVSGTLQAFYAKSEDAYTQVSGSFTSMGNDRYYIKHTFTSVGTYIIRITDTNNSSNAVTSSIDVVALSLSAVPDAIAALNDFNPTTDTVSRVTLVDTSTANSDMRGTDSANTVEPDNANIANILLDTNELQSNQANFATATGFSTHSDSDVVTAMQIVANDFKADSVTIDLSSIETKSEADIRQAALIAKHNDTQYDISTNANSIINSINVQTAALNITLNNVISYVSDNSTVSNIDLKVAEIWTQLGLNPSDAVNYQVVATWNQILPQ